MTHGLIGPTNHRREGRRRQWRRHGALQVVEITDVRAEIESELGAEMTQGECGRSPATRDSQRAAVVEFAEAGVGEKVGRRLSVAGAACTRLETPRCMSKQGEPQLRAFQHERERALSIIEKAIALQRTAQRA